MTSRVNAIKSLCAGQLLRIETNRELLEGIVKYNDIENLMLELDNARDINTNYEYTSSQMLAYQEIKAITQIAQIDIGNKTDSSTASLDFSKCQISTPLITSNSTDTTSEELEGRQTNGTREPQFKALGTDLSALDIQLLQTQLDSLVYITQTDQKYHKALADIRLQSAIGLLIDPIHTTRHSKTSLIAISTPQQIYIFDIINLGEIFKEFRIILESKKPRKAVHYGHRIVDHFKHRHHFQLSGIFDTFVAYCLVSKLKINKSLEETVESVFNIPDLYFGLESKIKVSSATYARPLSQDYSLAIAKKVAFQLKLCDHLLHEQMLKNFYHQCHQFSQTFVDNENNFEVAQQLHSRSNAGHEHIQPNGNWNDIIKTDLGFNKKDAC